MRINIISISYWPEPTGIGPYAAGAAEYLAAHGDNVNALVGVPHFPAWRRDQSAAVRTAEMRRGVRIVRFPHYVPTKHTALQRARYEVSFFAAVAKSRIIPHADFTVAVVPNVAAACVPLIRRRTCGPFGVIVQDVSSRAASQSGTPGGANAERIAGFIEGTALRRAAFVGVVSPAFSAPLIAMGVKVDRIIDVPNWTHIRTATRAREDVRRHFGWSDGVTVALHAGNMGRKQALETVVDSARVADQSDEPVLFVLMGDGNQRQHLEDYGIGVRKLQFLPPQPDELFPDILAAADVLLLTERASVQDMSLPSKLTSYFSSGRPVVAGVPSTGSTAAELLRASAGVIVPAEDPNALMSGVMNVANDRELARRLGEAGLRHCDDHLRPESTLSELRRVIHAVANVE